MKIIKDIKDINFIKFIKLIKIIKLITLTAKIIAVCVVAYAFSPVNLIPDFIPVVGYLDDLLLVPLGVYLTLRLFPSEVLEGYRAQAEERRKARKPKNWFTGALIIGLWLALALWACLYLYHRFFG
ncbi:DUF1232 domain-containing protein [Paenibacillus cremeus]|uniref:DUF1232 domain-containing protein n=1 Tax=Paenibacillus cremeus TaxID=2163881 RepID=A0A559K5F8_9BACL|nr:DUF1232 domain-containing protein [Paenibacillus cremeus]